jgi:hypothetical protein
MEDLKMKMKMNLNVGDIVYRVGYVRPEPYTIIGVEDDTIILPDKGYKCSVHKIKLSEMDKKLSCFCTTYEKAMDNIWNDIQKSIRMYKRMEKPLQLKCALNRKIEFLNFKVRG